MQHCYYDGYLKDLLTGLKSAVLTKNTSAVIIVDGRSGMGKTTLSNQLGNFLDETYNIEKMFWKPDKFLEGLSKAQKGDCLIFDEAMLLSNRSALSAVNRMTVQAMSMIRSKQIFVIFCVNSIFDLDRNLALSRADLLLHVYGDSLIDRGFFAAFFKPKGHEDKIKQLYLSGKKTYSYSFPPANFYGRFYKKFIIDEGEYERRKQEGINSFLSGEVKDTLRKRDLWLKNAVKKLLEDGYKKEEVAEILGCNKRTIYHLIE